MTQPPVDPAEPPESGAAPPPAPPPPPAAPPPAQPPAAPPAPPAAPGYGAPPPPPPPPVYPPGPVGATAAPATNQKAIWALVLGIVSFFCCGVVTGIVALVLGNQARNEIKGSGGAQGGDGMALAGMICGGVGIVLTLIQIPFWLRLNGN